ncbi:unnamed protein product [Rotaria magnacalcarata]|uniref:Uncharacterized protein n=4 Tax=Rotaria magnacalcarata TaxID=392030 RepID=A0A8S2JAQ1_9BILA|nr:unnamed protein product [Rotaria magnacalcarata]
MNKIIQDACDLAKNGTPKDFNEAIKKLSETNDPTIDILYLRGNAYLKLGGAKYNQEAIDDFSKALSLYDKPDQKPFISKLEIYYKRAWTYHILCDYDQALSDYSDMINRAKRSKDKRNRELLSMGYISRGLVYESMQLLKKAFVDIEQGIALSQEPINSYYKYCLERVRIGLNENKNEPDADEDIEEIVKNNDDGNDQNIECTEEDEQDTCEPLPSEKDIKEPLDKEDENAKYDEDYYRALLLSEKRKNKEAFKIFQQAFNRTKNHSKRAECLFRQGLCQHQLGDKDDARRLFELAKQTDPKHPRCIFRLGMMQAVDKKYKEAIEAFTTAHKYAPNNADILYERANAFEKLGKLDDAMSDRRHAMQLGRSVSAAVLMLEDRLRHLKAEILQHGESPNRHLEIGWAQEALHKFYKETTLFREEKGEVKRKVEFHNEKYIEAVNEYNAAILTDVEHLCPEAYAFLALCQRKGKDYLPAHKAAESLFENFAKHPESIEMWESFINKIDKNNYWDRMGFDLPESKRKELKNLETDRREILEDEKSFESDGNENRLRFYRKFRIQLSNVLAGFALGGTPQDVMAHNLKGPYHKGASVISMISKGMSSIPKIGFILELPTGKVAEKLDEIDYNLIKNKLEVISSCGDVIDQCNVARRVARQLADRYKEQLLMLHNPNDNIHEDCCSCCKSIMRSCAKPINHSRPAERVATFAVSYIVSVVADDSIKVFEKVSGTDSLAHMLVSLVSDAHGSKTYIPKCIATDLDLLLPLIPKPNVEQQSSQEQQLNLPGNNQSLASNMTNASSNSQAANSPSDTIPSTSAAGDYFSVYEFFRAPGIRYRITEDSVSEKKYEQQPNVSIGVQETQSDPKEQKVDNENDDHNANECIGSDIPQTAAQEKDEVIYKEWIGMPYMKPELYRYRLGTAEEVEILSMTEPHVTPRYQSPLPSPIKPYRNLMETNPIEDHFNDKRVRKHMFHLGLVPTVSDTQKSEEPSLDRVEHNIFNSEREKFKRFRRKFIGEMVYSIQEIDKARQAEFRNQIELWDKMYSNRIQRLEAYEKRLERKYGVLLDRALKKEIIKENLTRLPQTPSLVLSSRKNRVHPVVGDSSAEIAVLRSEMNKLRENHTEEIQNFKNRLQTLETAPKSVRGSPTNLNDLTTIENEIDKINKSLDNFDAKFQTMDKDRISWKNKFEELNKKNDEQQNSLKKDMAAMKETIKKLEQEIIKLQQPSVKKEYVMPYLEKPPPIDLLGINWTIYGTSKDSGQ